MSNQLLTVLFMNVVQINQLFNFSLNSNYIY